MEGQGTRRFNMRVSTYLQKIPKKNMSGWWYTDPSEKYESQLG